MKMVVALVISAIMLITALFGQASTSSVDGDLLKTFLTAGVAGAVIIGAIFGFIFFKPERTQLLATIAELRESNARYADLHEKTTLPTLTKGLTLFETVVSTLNALTRAWEEQARTNNELSRRLEALERRIESSERSKG